MNSPNILVSELERFNIGLIFMWKKKACGSLKSANGKLTD